MASKPPSKKSRAPTRSARKRRPSPARAPAAPSEHTPPGARRSLRLTAALTAVEGGYVARCLEVEVTSQGDTLEQALEHLREALELYFEDEQAPPPGSSPLIAPIEVML